MAALNKKQKQIFATIFGSVGLLLFGFLTVQYVLNSKPTVTIKAERQENVDIKFTVSDYPRPNGAKIIQRLDLVRYVKSTTARGVFPFLSTKLETLDVDSVWTDVKPG